MNYSESIEKLFGINLFNPKTPDLGNCKNLDAIFDQPHTSFQTIHIAGTNGKGSVATKIAKTLQLAGFKVGLFTSPHLFSFCERVQINSQKISEEAVAKHLTQLFDVVQYYEIPATFFELTTYLAYLYFREEEVDFVVLETGLGGRLDATNLVNPLLSVITSISLDHTEILGQTIEEIALEKAGIIKPGIPVIIGPTVPLKVIKNYAKSIHSPCIQVQTEGQTFQQENLEIAKTALAYLATLIKIPNFAMQEGLTAQPPYRFETLSSDPCIIMDVAHNPAGLAELFKSIYHTYPKKKLRILFGISKTKNIEACLRVLLDQKAVLHPISPSGDRCLSIDQVSHYLHQLLTDSKKIMVFSSLEQSVYEATKLAKINNEILVICGSFYIMQEVTTALQKIIVNLKQC